MKSLLEVIIDIHNEPFISVIMPAHNEECFIRNPLESIKKQLYKNYELIVVCDSCTDNTESIAQSHDAKTINIEKKNVGAARNEGVNHAKGDVLVFNDSDTIMLPNYLREVGRAIIEGNDYGCARLKAETRHLLGMLSALILNYYSAIRHYSHGNSFVRKDLFLDIGGFNEKLSYGQDTDLTERLKKNGKFKFLYNTFLISSERKFKEKGYVQEFFRKGKEGLRYLYARTNYYQKYLK